MLVRPGSRGVECSAWTARKCQSSLHASSNSFFGSIPICLLNASGLQLVDLSNNFFHGELPVGQVGTVLTELDASYNNIIGTIPSTLAGLANLSVLDVSQNFLSGTVPYSAVAKKQSHMAFLDFSSNCDVAWGYTLPFGQTANCLVLGECCEPTVSVCMDAPQRPVSLCAVEPPLAPFNVRAPPVLGVTSVAVSWVAPLHQHAPYAPLDCYIVSVALSADLSLVAAVNVSGDANSTVIAGLKLDTQYTISVVAYNSAGPGAQSLSTPLYIPSPPIPPFAFSVSDSAVIAAAQVVLYGIAAAASWRWPGSVRDARRDYSGLLALPFAAVHVGTDLYFGRQLLVAPVATVYIAVFITTVAFATLWSGYRVFAFLHASTSHAGHTPPPPHKVTFDVWLAGRRSWIAAVACAGSLQLSAMYVITCRAAGGVDGAMSAPVDARLWRTLKFHATAISFVRNVSSLGVALAVGAAAGGLLSPAVFLKLATSGTGAVMAVTTMAVDALGAAARRRERDRGGWEGGGLSMKLLSVEVRARRRHRAMVVRAHLVCLRCVSELVLFMCS